VAEYASAGSALSSGDMLAAYGYLPNQTWQTNPAYKRDVQTGTSNPDRVHLFHNDHLGSPQRLTDTEGKTSWAASFESFGRGYVDASSGTPHAVDSLTPTANNHRFPGQLLDAETGLAQNFFRDYSAGFGGYVQADPSGLAGGINRSVYAIANPEVYYDPDAFQIVFPPGPVAPPYAPPTVPGVGIPERPPGDGSFPDFREGPRDSPRSERTDRDGEPIENRNNRPCYMYMIVDCNQNIVYVGITQRTVQERCREHETGRSGKIRRYGCKQCDMKCMPIPGATFATRTACEAAEGHVIDSLRPIFNDAKNPDHPGLTGPKRDDWNRKNCC
jgi:RHS repeat-associated protein